MSTSIEEFNSKSKSDSYYSKTVKELSKLNEEFHAFTNINKELKDGFPFSVKDNICVKGVETTASSRILKGYLPNSIKVLDNLLNLLLYASLLFISKPNPACAK